MEKFTRLVKNKTKFTAGDGLLPTTVCVTEPRIGPNIVENDHLVAKLEGENRFWGTEKCKKQLVLVMGLVIVATAVHNGPFNSIGVRRYEHTHMDTYTSGPGKYNLLPQTDHARQNDVQNKLSCKIPHTSTRAYRRLTLSRFASKSSTI